MVTVEQIQAAYDHARDLQREWLRENGWKRSGQLLEKRFPEGLVVVMGTFTAIRYEMRHQKLTARIVDQAPPESDSPFHL